MCVWALHTKQWKQWKFQSDLKADHTHSGEGSGEEKKWKVPKQKLSSNVHMGYSKEAKQNKTKKNTTTALW